MHSPEQITRSIESEASVNPPTPVSIKSFSRGAWLQWGAYQRKTIYLFVFVIAPCAFFFLFALLRTWHKVQAAVPGHLPDFNDFFSLWSYAKIAGAHPAAELYDLESLHSRQIALGMNPGVELPFLYPPTFLIFLWPLSLLPFEVAYVVWIAGTFALFIWAVIATCTRLPLCVLAVIVAPACTINIEAGQSGFLSAALIVAGVRLARSRPILGGILIGGLSYKPQLALLVPIALASAGLWEAFAAACATVIGLAFVASLAFGWDVWPAWVSMLPSYAATVDGAREQLMKFMPTVVASLQMAGVPPPIAKAVQALVAIVATILVAACFRRCPDRLAAAALLVGTFLVTPHALLYDMPAVVAAMALFIDARLRTTSTSTFTAVEILILVLALMFPLAMMNVDVNLPVSALALLLLFGLIVWRQRSDSLPSIFAR